MRCWLIAIALTLGISSQVQGQEQVGAQSNPGVPDSASSQAAGSTGDPTPPAASSMPASDPASAPSAPAEADPELQKQARIDALLAEVDALYQGRAEPGQAEAAHQKALEVLALDAESYEAQWRIARSAFWIADGSKDSKVKEKWGKIGWDAGEAGVVLQPERVEARFWGAACIGHYAEGVGILKSFWDGLGKRYEKAVRKAMKMNPKYAWGGPARALGRYYFKLPGIAGGDNTKAIFYLEESKKIAPEALRTRAWLAEAYLDEGDKGRARAEIEFCLAADPTKGDHPDNVRMQPECTRLQEKL